MKFVDIFTKQVPYQRMKEVDTLPHYSETKKFTSSLKIVRNIGTLFKKPFIKSTTSNKDILLKNHHQNKTPIQNQKCHTDEIPSIESVKNKMYSNEFLAKNAFELVRKRFKNAVKSVNKIKFLDPKSLERQNKACNALDDIRGPNIQGHMVNYSESWEKGVGNCGEMSEIAAQFINKSEGYATQYKVDNKRTHVFTLVGIPPRTAEDHIHFSDYDNCWVVDPWAGIVCEASQYTKRFEEKMNQWSENKKHKMIITVEWTKSNQPYAKWTKPNNSNWLDTVVKGNKVPIYPESYYSESRAKSTWL
ncbi:hypothetical protein [Candidatus Williamhamiltonella defendens]|uniref:Uncharacterized protein n=1 Tax=Candidatus Hamiltonella defensa (Bemisia tabaci) TaxID=672795 RepID=A0A249DZ17_9ENTR|nr:hypothetical protein [Candidatus Hamiltonella defensa]ASX26147.1 hypothetical protein BA171_03335 [Candidatus Hamiltonella defensa (Bemisia tabaci)]CED78751.1 Conserved hypothetical protein [Candidatus Hamiltonella defensa (Bemisia tabaci)]